MSTTNRLNTIVGKLAAVPEPVRNRAVTLLFSRTVKFVGTARIDVTGISRDRVEMRLKNRKRVQNHIGGIHAAGMALLAESATGLVLGMNLPDDRIPLLKTLHVDYVKRCSGDLRAEATLTPAQQHAIESEPRGEVDIAVVLTDSAGGQPTECRMVWAWIPKKKS